MMRANEHRLAIISEGQAVRAKNAVQAVSGTTQQQESLRVEFEQLDSAIARYQAVVEKSDAQSKCFSLMLTYVSGMSCFCCKPDWVHYVVLSGEKQGKSTATALEFAQEKVIRVRMHKAVCDELWATCSDFGQRTVLLAAALRDSAIAERSMLSEESLEMFKSQEDLCNWLHDEVALHPFTLLSEEDGQRPTPPPNTTIQRRLSPTSAAVEPALDVGDASASPDVERAERRLDVRALGLDVLWEGRNTYFDQTWTGYISFADSSKAAHGQSTFGLSLVAAVALMGSHR